MDDAFLLLKNMGKTFKMVSAEIKKAIQKEGIDLSRQQGMLLRWLMEHDGIIQNELAWITYRDKASLARLVNKMEEKGYVIRKPEPSDRRAKLVFITVKGTTIAKRIDKILKIVAEKYFSSIPSDHVKKTMETLSFIQNQVNQDYNLCDK